MMEAMGIALGVIGWVLLVLVTKSLGLAETRARTAEKLVAEWKERYHALEQENHRWWKEHLRSLSDDELAAVCKRTGIPRDWVRRG